MADSDTADRKEEVPRRRRAERKVEPAAATACELSHSNSSSSLCRRRAFSSALQ